MSDSLRTSLGHLGDVIEETLHDVKPKLRGWLHLSVTPLTLAAGIVLIALSPTAATRIGSALFATSALLLFTVSAVYHTGTWSPRVWAVAAADGSRQHLRAHRWLLHAVQPDPARRHAAGRAAVGGLGRRHPRRAVPGVLDRRAALALHPDLHRPRLGGGVLHPRLLPRRHRPRPRHRHRHLRADPHRRPALHAGRRRLRLPAPNPSPRYFGFHEVFHSFTILAFVSHYVGVSLATYSLR